MDWLRNIAFDRHYFCHQNVIELSSNCHILYTIIIFLQQFAWNVVSWWQDGPFISLPQYLALSYTTLKWNKKIQSCETHRHTRPSSAIAAWKLNLIFWVDRPIRCKDLLEELENEERECFEERRPRCLRYTGPAAPVGMTSRACADDSYQIADTACHRYCKNSEVNPVVYWSMDFAGVLCRVGRQRGDDRSIFSLRLFAVWTIFKTRYRLKV